MSEEWEPPDELLSPAVAVDLNLAIRILSCEVIGRDICVLVGRFIAEQSLYAIWFHDEVKGSGLGPAEVLRLVNVGHEQVRSVFESWNAFEAALEASKGEVGGREILKEKSHLMAEELKRSIDVLIETRNSIL